MNDDFESLDVVSATECTGLIRIPAENKSEAEAYNDIYSSVPEQVNKKPRYRHRRVKRGC